MRVCEFVGACVRVGGRACVVAPRCDRPGSAAGRTFTSRTLTAEWAPRFGHTSVVDAAGTIYVIGGVGDTFLQDVWASTDRGARAGLAPGLVGVGTQGY